MKKALPIIIIILIIVGFSVAWKLTQKEASAPVSTPSASKDDLIRLDNPRPNQIIQSPLTITGKARGSWFFEASFPVKLLDENENIITSGIAQAQSDWMTENFVPFKAELEFQNPNTERGTLILQKDNPSGLPQNAGEFKVSVVFEKMDKQGVQIEILKEGTGAAAKNGDKVSVHYVGVLENGTKFDSSVEVQLLEVK